MTYQGKKRLYSALFKRRQVEQMNRSKQRILKDQIYVLQDIMRQTKENLLKKEAKQNKTNTFINEEFLTSHCAENPV